MEYATVPFSSIPGADYAAIKSPLTINGGEPFAEKATVNMLLINGAVRLTVEFDEDATEEERRAAVVRVLRLADEISGPTEVVIDVGGWIAA